MTESINVGQTKIVEVVWMDGDNGTGNEMPDPGQSTFVSDTPSVLSADAIETQAANVVGLAAGAANVQATSSTGIIAGSLDAGGAFVPGPLPFLVAVAAVIRSGILRLRAALGAAPKRA